MTTQHTDATATKPAGFILAFTAFGLDVWAEWLAAGKTPDWPHPRGKRWAVNLDGQDTAIYLGRVYITYGRTERRRAVPLADSGSPVGTPAGEVATRA